MPRNSSGTYSRPAGQPVVTGTSINSTDHNTLTADLATELTDSLSRSGKGGMTAPLRVSDGSVSAPSIGFSTETGTGLYRVGAAELGVAVTGTKVVGVTATGAAVTGTGAISGDATVGGTLGVTGAATLASAGVTGNATVGGTLGVTGATTLGPMAAALNMNTHAITGVTDPAVAQGAATKNYVDVTAGTSAATASALMRRDASGCVSVATPTASGHATTKAYVDVRSASVTTTVANVDAAGSPLVVFNAVSCPASFTFEAILLFDSISSALGFQAGFQCSATEKTFWAEGRNVAGTLVTVAATTATVNMTFAAPASTDGLVVIRGQFYGNATGTITMRAQRASASDTCIIRAGSALRIF